MAQSLFLQNGGVIFMGGRELAPAKCMLDIWRGMDAFLEAEGE